MSGVPWVRDVLEKRARKLKRWEEKYDREHPGERAFVREVIEWLVALHPDWVEIAPPIEPDFDHEPAQVHRYL